MPLTKADVPPEVYGVEPSWAEIQPQALAWGPFIVRAFGFEVPAWGLLVEDDENGRWLAYSIEDRKIRLPLLGGPHVVGKTVEALCRTGRGREAVRIRAVKENDERLLQIPIDGSGLLVDRMRKVIGW